ncbi:hypothetical protein WDW89_07585 [Deltaproteobacteria bacterium TL4]
MLDLFKSKKKPSTLSKIPAATNASASSAKGVEGSGEDTASPARSPQYSEQWELWTTLYRKIPGHPWDESTAEALKKALDALQKDVISDALQQTYTPETLDQFKNYALREYEVMGRINRTRMLSLWELAAEDMRQVLFESLLLFDINPVDSPTLELSEREGFDASGNPVLEKQVFEVFPPNASSGLANVERFLPQEALEGKWNLKSFLESEYPELGPSFKSNPQPAIEAITTIGSLGGIGHKSDSDVDAQVIYNTDPHFNYSWNDADFMLALITHIYDSMYRYFFEHVLSDKHRLNLEITVKKEMQEKYASTFSPEELEVLALVFPSSYQQRLCQLTWTRIEKLDPEPLKKLLKNQILKALQTFPHFERYVNTLTTFFPSLKELSKEQIYQWGCPFSLRDLDTKKVRNWLVKYYQKQVLGPRLSHQLLSDYAQQEGVSLAQLGLAQQQELTLKHFFESKQRGKVIINFLTYLAENLAFDTSGRWTEILIFLRQVLGPQEKTIKDEIIPELVYLRINKFRAQMVMLAEGYFSWKSEQAEALAEYQNHHKVQQVEAYLNRKYPNTEVHFFVNILRKQRAGRHTPFLVSPEGSMAYSLMLNDLLLNPAVFVCGTLPMPFDLPHDFKVLCTIGAFPPSNWELTQTKEDGSIERFTLQSLPNWGSLEIPRVMFWEHAIPIFLRESEKVSHRNLPKALLNCWWIEMICCLEEETEVPTSLTRLLWNPEQRFFYNNEALQHPWREKILEMEAEFTVLASDPWWMKFTEMLFRFQDSEVQKQILFCFAQHLLLSDIIDFDNDGKPVWIENNAPWRTKALIRFYQFFFQEHEDMVVLIRFAQGRDDVGNEVEKILKRLFVESMKRVEQKLLNIGNLKAARMIAQYLRRYVKDIAQNKEFKILLEELLKDINPKVILADERLLKKGQTLSAVEQIQVQTLQEDQRRMLDVSEKLKAYCQRFDLNLPSGLIEKYILTARVKMAGDPLENVIFKYHFERNFEKKAYQVPLPISKSLSIPRKQIMVEFDREQENWIFHSVLSKKEARSGVSPSGKQETEIAMFSDHLIEGLSRCVFSKYIGFSAHNLTSFQKPPVRARSAIAQNPVTHQDLQTLSAEINDFFPQLTVRSRELLEDIHYIRDIFMVCNINAFNTISLIVRDNFDDHFVINFPVAQIKIKVDPKMMITNDQNFPMFFQRFNSIECRHLFLETVERLNIPIRPQFPPNFKVWVNVGNFDLPLAPKFYRIYVNGIANLLWPREIIGTSELLSSRGQKQTFDQLGKQAIQHHQELELRKKQLWEKANQKNAMRARAYMSRKRQELGL